VSRPLVTSPQVRSLAVRWQDGLARGRMAAGESPQTNVFQILLEPITPISRGAICAASLYSDLWREASRTEGVCNIIHQLIITLLFAE
jgi:hypothetical protein